MHGLIDVLGTDDYRQMCLDGSAVKTTQQLTKDVEMQHIRMCRVENMASRAELNTNATMDRQGELERANEAMVRALQTLALRVTMLEKHWLDTPRPAEFCADHWDMASGDEMACNSPFDEYERAEP